MTRSPKQHPKTSTISRRLRSRADQNLSVQPPELPLLRSLRSRRTETPVLAPTRRPSVSDHFEDAHPPAWHPAEILDPFPHINSNPTGVQDNLLAQSLVFSPYHSPHNSPQPSPAEPASLSTQSEVEHFIPPSTLPELLPSPLPSLPDAHLPSGYELRLSADSEHLHDHTVQLQNMSTLGYMMPAPYPMDHYGSPPTMGSPTYPPINTQPYSESRSSQPQPPSSGAYAPSYTSSPALQSQNESRRSGEHNVLPPYQPSSVPRSPYQQSVGSLRASPTPMSYPPSSAESSPMMSSAPQNYSYPAMHPIPGQSMSPTIGSHPSNYPPPPIYPPTSYDMGYTSLPTTMYPPATTAAYSPYEQGGMPQNSTVPGLSSSPADRAAGVMPRVLNSRPKPQCWEHGCNGRQFSTFSNLLRHQREKSGTAAKSYCPRCGAEFTRTTARNGHMAHDKCKPRRSSDTSR